MTFCLRRIVSTVGSVNSGFCSRVVLSTLESVHLAVRLLDISQLGSPSTRHSAHVGLCPLLVLSTLDCADCWFRLLGNLSIWVFVYLDSVQFGVRPLYILPRRIESTYCSVHSGFCLRMLLSILDSFHLDVCLLRICPLWSLAT